MAAALSPPPASISKSPVAVHNSSLPTTSIPTGSTEATVTVPDNGAPKEKQRQLLLTSGLNQENSEFVAVTSKAKCLIVRSSPEPLRHGLVKLRMLKVVAISENS